jgi:DNA polymerase III epsilon subunit-like protein
MYLFFDTETTGLPKKWDAPLKDLGNWPRMVQFAWQEHDKNGKVISSGDYIIKPDGYEIPEEVVRIHKIDNQKAIEEGYSLRDTLEVIKALIAKSTYLVAHNISFDEKIIGAEFLREYMDSDLAKKRRICTMEETVDFMKLPSDKGGYKFPGLADLHRKLFGEGFKNAHDAAVDIDITAKIFWELVKLKVIDPDNKKTKQPDPEPLDDGGSLSLF